AVKLRIGILLVFVATLALAQDGATLKVVPITGLPEGSVISSFDLLETEGLNRLVVEIRDRDGIVSFYTFDYVDGTLHGRMGGVTALPMHFRDPSRAVPSNRTIAGIPKASRYWAIGGMNSPVAHDQFLTAVPLAERRFVDASTPEHAALPPVRAGLSIEYVLTDVNNVALSRCVLEPNLIRTSERMTAVSAEWILAQGRQYLLVGLATDAAAEPWPLFYRLYSQSMELVFQSNPVLLIDPNRYPQPVSVDLTGDGEAEIVTFSNTADGSPMVVLQPRPGDPMGHRMLALNDCDTRMNGDDITALQRELERRGYSVGPFGVDGWYGPDTRSAVVAFQRSADLLVSGVVDDATWRLLGFR
ncbi:MAG: peptidoglycan-binding protein, partial [Spirochaetaceae bacterium]|nr:peptidoglycan-binding protein [Spirochaetaceae bacterium]